MPSESALRSSTRIVHSIRLSGDLKVYWSRLLVFSFQHLPSSQILQQEITAASHPFSNSEEAVRSFNQLGPDDQHWLISSLNLLLEQAAKTNDWISHRNLDAVIIQLAAPTSETEKQLEQIRSEFTAHENRKTFIVPGSIAVISLDFLLRCLLLIGYDISNGGMPGTLFGLNVVVVLPVLAFAARRFRKDRILNEKLIANSDFKFPFKVKYTLSTFQYTLVGVCLAASVIISLLALGSTSEETILVGIILVTYYLALTVLFPIGRLTEENLLRQLHGDKKKLTLDPDDNDEAIVLIETRLNSNTSRLEAYVLESALFGALTFSGFLQIIANDLVSFSDLEKFASAVYRTTQSLALGDFTTFSALSGTLNNKVNLLCLVSIEMLICSALFLAVIASRLRFSNVADKVRTALNMAKTYNDKEEFLLEGTSHDNKVMSRLQSLNRKIGQHLQEAENHIAGIEPIVGYMVYFRNAGLLFFLIVLISSSLFITSILAWAFVAVAIATWIYFNLKIVRARLISCGLLLRILFARYTWQLFALAFLPGIFAFFIRIGLQWNTNYLMALSFVLVGLYFYGWLVALPHADQRFGNIENLKDEAWRSSAWKAIKNSYGILIFVSFLGMAFKIAALMGANEMLLIGLAAISLMQYPVGFYLARPWWLGFLSAAMLGTSGIGILFKMLRFTGSDELVTGAFALIPVFFILYSLKRKSFHYILLRLYLVFSVAILLMSTLIIEPSGLRRIQFMYDHCTLSLNPILRLHSAIHQPDAVAEHSPMIFERSLKGCDDYIQTYGTRFGRTEVYREATGYYIFIAEKILSNPSSDTTSLHIALRAARQANKIKGLFGDRWSEIDEARALLALGRKEDAKTFLQHALAGEYEDVRAEAKQVMEQIK